MRNRLFWILAVVLVLGMGAVLGAGLVSLAAHTDIVQAANLPAENRDAGILVGAVQADSPAAKAGLVRGDIIVAVDGTALDAKSAPVNLLKDKKAGDKLTLKVLHGDEVRTVDVVLVDQNGNPFLGIIPAFTGRMGAGMGRFPGTGQVPGVKGAAGAHVLEVVAGGPAEKAGVKVGDIILKVNDKALDATNDLAKAFAALKPGDSVKLTVQRKGETAALDLQVTLGDTPAKAGTPYLGIKYQMLPDFSAMPKGQNPGLPQVPQGQAGLVVTEVKTGSPAEKAGLKARDVIAEVNAKAVTSADDFVKQVQAAKIGDKLTLTVTRAGEANALKIDVVLGANPDKSDQAYLGISIGNMLRGGFPRGLPNNGGPGGRQRGAPAIQGSNS
jgi:S1-C subfamily serine protease